MGLRERKKLRTRETIVRVALGRFVERGYQGTTLSEIAEAAEIAPSTLHAYFPSKDEILFSFHDAIRTSARTRIIERSESETLVEAMQAWITEELPDMAETESGPYRQRRAIIEADESLLAQERLRNALLEDVFAEAFANDLEEAPDDLRSRLLASAAVNGLRAIWQWWNPQRADTSFDPRERYRLDAIYLTNLITAAETALEVLPKPPRHHYATPEPNRPPGQDK